VTFSEKVKNTHNILLLNLTSAVTATMVELDQNKNCESDTIGF